jgi:GNAT superfamily N-acetyltransferase
VDDGERRIGALRLPAGPSNVERPALPRGAEPVSCGAMDVRPAVPADAPTLAELRYEFRSAERPAAESRAGFVARASDWMRERLAAGSPWRCFVAERGGAIAGHVWVQLLEKVPNPGGDEPERHAYLTNLYVRPAARGGTGGLLLRAALAWCRTQDVDSVILWPSARSRSLYARHGFVASGSIVSLALRGAATPGARPGSS